ncbi:hypothetical protein CEXT_463761 [Caerostris extrusa]|uniref:Uncharacterized protein n=1 Tax=Caerostris extrusa TaxID=172846 RepID=A0AAV4US47_CAEEX|nr:hypothetical protein CEXT_463761 [Caerostris extrusa]
MEVSPVPHLYEIPAGVVSPLVDTSLCTYAPEAGDREKERQFWLEWKSTSPYLSVEPTVRFESNTSLFQRQLIFFEIFKRVMSGGELEYDEALADLFYKMVKEGTDKGLLSLSDNEGGFKKIICAI